MSNVSPIKKVPEPIEGLTEWESALWKRVVKEWPNDYFKTCDLPLLAEYCRAASQCEDLAQWAGKADTIERLGAALALRDRESKRMASIARTLRLAPQSRYDRHATATKARMSGSRPWEMHEEDDDEFFSQGERFFKPKPPVTEPAKE